MYLRETPQQQAFRTELRQYFASLLTAEKRVLLGNEATAVETRRALYKTMGADGWLGVGWPVEYGGMGRSTSDQFIFVDEAKRADCPMPFVTLNTVGPTLIAQGSEELKKAFLPGILAGEIIFAVGYTEPEAGTDLASLRTRAERDGDEWIINGQKIWTSGAHEADYVWLACRTNPEVKKHRGISIIIVPTTAEGFSVTPLETVGGMRSNASYYDNIRVPAANLVGEVNDGWRLITSQLNHERVGLGALSVEALELLAQTTEWVGTVDDGAGGRLIDVPWVQRDLAECSARMNAMNLLNWQMVKAVEDDTLNGPDASAVKVYGTEAVVDVYNKLLGIVGAAGRVRAGSPGAILQGRLERAGRAGQINTFGGGVNEVQRDVIAWMRLGLSRAGSR